MIPIVIFLGWFSLGISSASSQPAWHDPHYQAEVLHGHPPAGCYFAKQWPRRWWPLFPRMHKTKDVLCWQDSQLSGEAK